MTFISTRRQRGMLRFLLVDGALFLVIFVGYWMARYRSPEWPAALHFPSAIMALAMTLFVFSGSFTMYAGRNAQAKGDFILLTRLVIATAAVWIMFLICAAMEWARLLFFERPPIVFAETFCLLTGYHALHLLAGMPYLFRIAARPERSDAGAAALFVHFTNLVWLPIFLSVYLFGTDLEGL